jgi:integrase
MKLTKGEVDKLTLPEGKSDHFVWDDSMPGFGVRLRNQNKTYVVQYRVGRQKQRREALGDVRKVTLEAARTIARRRFAAVELGDDPGAERRAEREAANAVVLTLGDVAKRYLDAKRDVLRSSTYKSTERNLNVHFGPLSGRPIAEIKRQEIAARLQEIVKQFGRTAAARARSTLSTTFVWALKEGLVETSQNPVTLVNDPLAGIDNSRSRVLSNAELVKVWRATRDDDFGRIVRLLILLGLRRDEVGSLKWSEIDLSAGTLTISAERSKNHKAHTLTLPPMALDILQSIPRRENRDYVFGRSGQGFQRWGAYTTALRGRLGDIPEWRIHDLRRSCATGMAEIGIQPNIIEAILNHVSGHKAGVAGIYNRAAYAEPMRVALQRWAEHVGAIIEGRLASNITPLRRA